MARKILDCRFYWPTIFRDAYQFVSTCKKCQKAGMTISKTSDAPTTHIVINFMGPFPVSNDYSYILLAVDYVLRWVEAIATKTNDAKFGLPKVLISDQGSHFYNKAMSSLLHKYGVVHRIATANHP
ncbi:Pro-Pol polyprotein, partial [Mucuna pruriens]